MKIYLVGGAVRDKLLNLPVNERDYVVVGATIADMLTLGYQQVGKEFPVFLHPKTREEYALARMERKTHPGYTGFSFDTSPDVTLEEDLKRRDLTINAMARDCDTDQLIDPYGGQDDLAHKRLRHVSPAFAEDPVRILRVGRFLARYARLGFGIAPDTLDLMRKMVASGEVNALVAERVWKEWERALGEPNPEMFFEVLEACHALPILFPDLVMNHAIPALKQAVELTPKNHLLRNSTARPEEREAHLERSAPQGERLPSSFSSENAPAIFSAISGSHQTAIRFAALLHHLTEATLKTLCDCYRVPNDYRELALMTIRHYQAALMANHSQADALLRLFYATDIFRRLPRFKAFLVVCTAIAHASEFQFDPLWLHGCATAALDCDVQVLIKQGLTDKALADALRQMRQEKIQAWLKKNS